MVIVNKDDIGHLKSQIIVVVYSIIAVVLEDCSMDIIHLANQCILIFIFQKGGLD
jgi:hypothetical protein